MSRIARTTALTLALSLLPRTGRAQTCTPSTPIERQYRTGMKHRAPGPAGTPLTVAAMLAWPAPTSAANAGIRAHDTPVDPREARSFTIEGDLWRVKVEDNDCDLHLELAAPGSDVGSPRVIAEVPAGPGYEAARAAILAAVRLPSARAGDRLDLAAPVRMRLTGYAFWDGAHWCRRDATRGCSHGTPRVATLWELHPAWRVEVLSPGAPPIASATVPGRPRPAPAVPEGRVVCCDGWTSPCACGHPPRMHCCRGHRGECGGCGPRAR